jgi:hypothetical protein
MDTQGVTGFGTLLKIGDGASPENFTAILEVKDISGPSRSVEFAEFTHQQSPSGYREYKPTFKASGDITFKCNYVPSDTTQGATVSGLTKDFENKTLRNFKLEFPTSPVATYAFHAYVAAIGPTAPIGGPLELNVTLRLTGSIAQS